MKDILLAVIDSLEKIGTKVAALEGILIANNQIDPSRMKLSEQTALGAVHESLSSLRAAIASLPE